LADGAAVWRYICAGRALHAVSSGADLGVWESLVVSCNEVAAESEIEINTDVDIHVVIVDVIDIDSLATDGDVGRSVWRANWAAADTDSTGNTSWNSNNTIIESASTVNGVEKKGLAAGGIGAGCDTDTECIGGRTLTLHETSLRPKRATELANCT
jgi:hypothetical protein